MVALTFEPTQSDLIGSPVQPVGLGAENSMSNRSGTRIERLMQAPPVPAELRAERPNLIVSFVLSIKYTLTSDLHTPNRLSTGLVWNKMDFQNLFIK